MSEPGFEEGDCPLCLEQLPPFWDTERRAVAICCGKEMCKSCRVKQSEYLEAALNSGSWSKQEEQQARYCSLCRAPYPTRNGAEIRMIEKFEKGQLPLTLYRELALAYLEGGDGVEKNVGRGMEILMLGAKKGDPNCQYMIGSRYSEGDGLPKSPKEAQRWWVAATEQGHAIAEFNLAIMAKDEGNEFLHYLRSSASKGYDGACYGMGLAYYQGNYGLQKSTEGAIRVLNPAAERGHEMSMRLLGTVMCQPDSQRLLSLPRDNPSFTKGLHWMRRAAATGDEASITALRVREEKYSSVCFRCDKWAPPETAFLRCSRCRAAWYCGKDCQVQHWRAEEGGHKQFCIKWE